MIRLLIASTPRNTVHWCACALLVIAPGSFLVLPAIWLARKLGAARGRRRAGST